SSVLSLASISSSTGTAIVRWYAPFNSSPSKNSEISGGFIKESSAIDIPSSRTFLPISDRRVPSHSGQTFLLSRRPKPRHFLHLPLRDEKERSSGSGL